MAREVTSTNCLTKNYQEMKMLILTNTPNSGSVKKLVAAGQRRGHEMVIHDPSDLVPYVSSTKSGHDGMFTKNDEGEIQRLYSKHYDVVIPRFSGQSFAYGCAMLQHFSGNLHVPVTSEALAMQIASNKFSSHQAFSIAQVRTIPSLFVNKPTDFKFIVNKLGLPLVTKTPLGSQGSGVFILSDELSISTTLSAFSRINRNLILQKFIDTGNPKSDIRIFIVGGKIVASYRRWALAEDFRSNYSLSKTGEKVKLTSEEEEMSVQAAGAVGLLGVCGVDLCRDFLDDNKPYIVEANGNPSLMGVTSVTGVDVAKEIIIYAEKIGRKQKDHSKNTADDNHEAATANQSKSKSLTDFVRENQGNYNAIFNEFEKAGL